MLDCFLAIEQCILPQLLFIYWHDSFIINEIHFFKFYSTLSLKKTFIACNISSTYVKYTVFKLQINNKLNIFISIKTSKIIRIFYCKSPQAEKKIRINKCFVFKFWVPNFGEFSRKRCTLISHLCTFKYVLNNNKNIIVWYSNILLILRTWEWNIW